MYYKFTDPDGFIIRGSEVAEVRYPLPKNGMPGEWLDTLNPYTWWGSQLSTRVLTDYDTPPYYVCFEAEGQEPLDHYVRNNNPRRGFGKVRLIRQLTDEELDHRIDQEFANQLGRPNIYLPVSWTRKATFLDRPIDFQDLSTKIWQVAVSLGRVDNIEFLPKSKIKGLDSNFFDYHEDSLIAALYTHFSDDLHKLGLVEISGSEVGLNYCLNHSVTENLRANIHKALNYNNTYNHETHDFKKITIEETFPLNILESIYYERAFTLVKKPIPELETLLAIWRSGVLPLGWYENKFVCIVP